MAQKKRKPTAAERRNRLVINILTLIVLVLLVFEGKSLISLFSTRSIKDQIRLEEEEVFASADILQTETAPGSEPAATEGSTSASTEGTASEAVQTETTEKKEEPKDPAPQDLSRGLPDGCENYLDIVVPAQASEISEDYFSDAVFIGDSRMQGFRNLSGINKGSFVTAVGMELENFYTASQIATAKGNVTVMDALKEINYSKIYMMLGTNELGAYDISTIDSTYSQVLADIKTCSSSKDPIVYVFSVIYVDEPLVTTGDYVNNANVDAINKEILEMCQREGYHYINLNEIMSTGDHALIPGASEDGIHLDQEYCQKWLEYTRFHYLPIV